ncbi:hypothetical protein LBMAG42_05370 [Deltaproteobacteria bacterium]|nr:hypothetical protein LBMAG42_05370 [Deltaproteobacteria bacterium]
MTPFFLVGCDAPGSDNVAPEVAIVSPVEGADFRANEPFTLTGQVDDDDGPNALALEWTFDPELDDPGNPLTADGEVTLYLEAGLPQHDYQISLTATDVFGLTATDSVRLDITPNDPPRVSIKEPNEDQTYDYGDPVIVEVEVNPKDDDMSEIDLVWGGVAEGAENAPAKPPENGLVIFYVEGVSKGKKDITVTARDSGSQEDTETIHFTIR